MSGLPTVGDLTGVSMVVHGSRSVWERLLADYGDVTQLKPVAVVVPDPDVPPDPDIPPDPDTPPDPDVPPDPDDPEKPGCFLGIILASIAKLIERIAAAYSTKKV